MEFNMYPNRQGLYDPIHEKGSCGVGFIVDVKGKKTYETIQSGLEILKNMSHRGATGADPDTGDGAGLLIQIPHDFFSKVIKEDLKEDDYAVGMVFLPMSPNERYFCEGVFERILKEEGLDLITWRDVPVNDKACGSGARGTKPYVKQVFIKRQGELLEFERKLYMARKGIEKAIGNKKINDFFICSLSTKTIVYKGQFLAHQIEGFYPELLDQDMKSALAVVHQRYSTNTFPSWRLAHPYRYVAHNGEINTIRGNVKWMSAREGEITSKYFEDLDKVLPIIQAHGSDSFNFDNVLEFLVLSGYSLPHALKMLMPEAWRYDKTMPKALRAFYEYHEGLVEAWDGPATMAFSDGRYVGVSLDRNGLRPARYVITKDDKVILASEAGVLALDDKTVIKKGKLGPGAIFMVDTSEASILENDQIKYELSHGKAYDEWIKRSKLDLSEVPSQGVLAMGKEELISKQLIFNYTEEELKRVLAPMASKSKEAVSSMGNDVPLAVLSEKPQLMFNYFRQMFAQVTNPPIDPIREKKVMSLNQYLGRSGNILKPLNEKKFKPFVELEQPILYREKMAKIKNLQVDSLRSVTLPTIFEADQGEKGFKDAIDLLLKRVDVSVEKGYRIIVLSDRDVDRFKAPLPSILALASVHNHLIDKKLRTKVDLIVETGEARDPFHMALLIGYGATAVYPYLALESIEELVRKNLYIKGLDEKTACMNYVRAIGYGIRKITSKMGISTLRSFNGAQIFEIIGLDEKLIENHFKGTPHKLSGIGYEGLFKEAVLRHEAAFKERVTEQILDIGGNIHWRKGSEPHLLTPDAIAKLQHACKIDDYGVYKDYAKLVNDQSKHLKTIRGLIKFKTKESISLDQVEPVESIVTRFATGAMSFGSLSKEVHETLAIAMNKIGGKSNSGEGGEDDKRYIKTDSGYKRSAIKQVAAGRFGVDTNYLIEADELQIKVAQGAKPGEGGHLPGSKVTKEIAKVRHSLQGIDLISPPPHHDIYSIEDLEQLIFDLKNVNPKARVSVKLVSESGVGTIAAGVAKGSADMVLISGHDGGTGAAPITSVKSAGVPWEIGLSETHQTLLLNNLRSRIAVQVDGQLRTGRDVAIGALLGAEEFGFATAPLIVCGCIMMRQCHNNTCPVGVATQDPELRKHFTGKPEHVINYFRFVAMELREVMASLGIRTLAEMIGRVDLLEVNKDNMTWKTEGMDLDSILYKPDLPSRFGNRQTEEQLDPTLDVLDRDLIKKSKKALELQKTVYIKSVIRNQNRSTGTMLSGELIKKHGKFGLPEDTINIELNGVSGQSFGAFLAPGISLDLIGEANDYVGKGLSGGKLIVRPPESSAVSASDNIIAGNTVLYGATKGKAFICGRAGERFAVRNSGATAVVEGIGDHGCEYMTGGRVLILGKTGRNFAAGMSGGIAYILDEDERLRDRINFEMVELDKPDIYELDQIHELVKEHVSRTGSVKGKCILEKWDKLSRRFVKVISPQYKALTEKQMDGRVS